MDQNAHQQSLMPKVAKVKFSHDKEITFETGRVARLADGAVWLRCKDTVVFASACAGNTPEECPSFFPFKVDFQEKFSSVGKTLGGFIKREGRPSEREVLVSRLIDRPLRPLFREGYMNEVQLLCYVYSYDGESPLEPLAITAASAALLISSIPFENPVAAVRVGMLNGEFVVNPSPEEQKKSTLDLVLAGTTTAILMIEGSCAFLTEEQILSAIEKGHAAIKEICQGMKEWAALYGKEKNTPSLFLIPAEVKEKVVLSYKAEAESALKISKKAEREAAIKALKTKLKSDESFVDVLDWQKEGAFEELLSSILRMECLEGRARVDGRKVNEVRPITIEQAVLPRTHGSALFTRGETQALAVCTLGGKTMAQKFEDLHGEGLQQFYLQYTFPPFSVGEVGRIGSPGRREVGHGKLAERALLPVLPLGKDFPYTIRLESNIMESNGSSSMATVCGGCLALMDAGVPIQRPVAGIAMGLILEGEKFAILSDILGIEDALGDMDFKITGDALGITAFQMDIKVEGITLEIMRAALSQASSGIKHILSRMLDVCPKPRVDMSPFAPRITTLQILPSKIGTVIGPGGKQIRAIMEESGAQVDIDDSGQVSISAPSATSIDKAVRMVENLTAEVVEGKVYRGKISSIKPFGIFVEVLPGKDGLCHISEFDHQRIESLEGLVNVGDMIDVKVLEINKQGQIRLSRKVLL